MRGPIQCCHFHPYSCVCLSCVFLASLVKPDRLMEDKLTKRNVFLKAWKYTGLQPYPLTINCYSSRIAQRHLQNLPFSVQSRLVATRDCRVMLPPLLFPSWSVQKQQGPQHCTLSNEPSALHRGTQRPMDGYFQYSWYCRWHKVRFLPLGTNVTNVQTH